MDGQLWEFLQKFAFAAAPMGCAFAVWLTGMLIKIDKRLTVVETKIELYDKKN